MEALRETSPEAGALREGKLYTGVVEGYNSDGAGIIKPEGAVVFVPGTLRGETVEFRVTRTRKNFAEAEAVRILEPSPMRRDSDCPYFGECGGCDFRRMAYEEELRAKRQRVQDALRRIGGVEIEVEPALPAERPRRYRNKCQYPVSASGVIGFYRAGSHEVVDVRECLLQPEAANRSAEAVREWMRRYGVPGYDERTGKGLIRHVYIRVNRHGESLCCIVANGKSLPREAELVGLILAKAPGTLGVVMNTNTRRDNVILGARYRTLWGQNFLYDSLRIPSPGGMRELSLPDGAGKVSSPDGMRELSFKVSLPSFYQVNAEQTEKLYALALECAALNGAETALDLYCGTGTITLSLALWAGKVIGAEIVERAVADARENALRNGIANAEFICADASELAQRLNAEGLRPDVVTVDPPRKGLTPEGIAAIGLMEPSRIVYVSCDPGTLARDVKLFAERGYAVRRAAPVDMFPGTRHVETVVLLSQQKPDDRIVVDLDLDELDATASESKATYAEIKAYVWEHHALKVSSLYISQVKRKCGLEVGKNYNVSKSENPKVPQCPPEKERAIMEALRHFKMV